MAMTNQGAKTIVHTLRDALFQFVIKSRKLASPMLKQFGCSSEEPVTVDDEELRALKFRLRRIRAALRDAERLSVADHSVRLWLSELGDLEYRAEDVLEELEYEWRRAAELEELKIDLLRASATSTGKRKREVALLFAAAPPRRLRRKIEDIWARYEEVASDRKKLRLRPGDGVARPVVSALMPSSSLPRGQLYGRSRDLERVAELVLQPDDGKRNYAVVPIVGMAGVGKTALVQHVCSVQAVASHFDLTLWIWVSQEFDVVGVTAKMVEAITRTRPECCELSTLHEVVAERLKGKRFLMVLDDVWDTNPFHWNSLIAPLACCAPGSTVVVTTRSRKVAMMASPKVYQLNCLSDDDCWLVCQGRALHNGSVNTDQELVRIGEQIAKKCRGLPLAAEAVGSALSTSVSWKHWSHVLESNLLADYTDVKNLVLPALKLSYDNLPMPLKRCFALCSLFPKGFVFEKDTLVQLWTAQGFVDAEGKSCPNIVGGGYFDDLVSRSFFRHSPSHDVGEGKFIMHDLYQELAQFVSGNECRMVQHHCSEEMDENPRHLSLVHDESHPENEIRLDLFHGHDLRTLLFFARMEHNHGETPFRTKIPCELAMDFECLRALDLSNTNMMVLPMSIGSLIHLRYLCLDNSGIQIMPESIGALFHMQTIKLNHCSSLTQLPQSIKLLLNLRCLEIPHSNIQIPSGIRELTRLHRLPIFTVGNRNAGCSIEELNELVNLRGDLHIIGLNNLDAAHSASVNIREKTGLRKLTLEWSDIPVNLNRTPQVNEAKSVSDSCVPQVDDVEAQMLQVIIPNSNLEELTIKGYNGPWFPSWLGCLPLHKLACIELKDCQNCEKLPPLGCLPSLKHVLVQALPNVKLVGPEFFGEVEDFSSSSWSKVSNVFPALESLKFRNMQSWEEWSGVKVEHFPELKFLSIARCCKLKVLPQFTSGPKLRIRFCEKLAQLSSCQVLETMPHLLLDCPFTRKIWHEVLAWTRSTYRAPALGEGLLTWWRNTRRNTTESQRKGLDNIVLLTTWMVWKDRNVCTFDGARLNIQTLLGHIKEALNWARVGAMGLRVILPYSWDVH